MLIKAKEKKERALGVKLQLKAERCASPKCAMVRRAYRPGMHGKSRRRAPSEYGLQLLEKQRLRISYGLREGQLRRLFKESLASRGNAAEAIVGALERQLSNVVYRLGFAPSRITARQFISHGHFLVNGKKITIPSYRVKPGDVISIEPDSRELLIFKDLPATIKKHMPPSWLEIDKDKLEGRVNFLPREADMPFDINLVVDYYSK